MNITTNKVTNCNIYMDGKSYMGRSEEVTLPDVMPKMADHKGLGMFGEAEVTAGLQKMSAKIKWNAIYPEVMRKTHDFFNATNLTIRASIETWDGGSRVAQTPCIIFLRGTWKMAGGLGFKPQDNVEREDEMNVTAYKMEINGEEIVNIDVLANIWRVNGVDQLAQWRQILGA
ncbi:phage major tail tube protein [Arachidicoccus terrestris]|uniref:phage major tail tube protein n=1 Tax=Arachidicoccus terrestris TaxID=2875539 RepID=UPI001CC3944B|nr:phage major tail tube protein [Arachidicoccus terrestris]UAY56264.1 phage major tail tube protein [Arachidicoccus terrestris]